MKIYYNKHDANICIIAITLATLVSALVHLDIAVCGFPTSKYVIELCLRDAKSKAFHLKPCKNSLNKI